MSLPSNPKALDTLSQDRYQSTQKEQADQVNKIHIYSWNLYILGAHLVPIKHTNHFSFKLFWQDPKGLVDCSF